METNYWLSRNGAAAEGPFAESQLHGMWQAGHMTVRDLLCREGREEWIEAGTVMDVLTREQMPHEVPPPMPRQVVYVSQQAPKKHGYSMVKAVLVVVCFIIIWIAIKSVNSLQGNSSGPDAFDIKYALDRWASRSFADAGAQVMDYGSALPWEKDYVLRLVSVRGKNAFGGPVINTMVVEMSNDRVIYSWSPKEWISIYSSKAEALKHPQTVDAIKLEVK